MHKWHEIKPVQICMRVPDVESFYEYCKQAKVDELSELFVNTDLQIKAFVFNDCIIICLFIETKKEK